MKKLILFIRSLAAILVAQTKLTAARAGVLVAILFMTSLQMAEAIVGHGLLATKRDQLLVDTNGNGLVSPGDMLKYTIVITNNGGSGPATNVMFNDPLDPNLTLVPGSVNSSPIARNDSYSAIGNVSISVLAGQGLLINDNDPDAVGPALTVMSFQNPSANGGNVSVTNDGSFFYNPPPGFTGTDTFTYTISDGEGFTDTGTVTITVNGMIWFINASAGGGGDGRLSSPFNSIANFNSVAADDPGDNIFLYSGNYTGPLTLLNNQRLIGQGAAQSLTAITGLTPQSYSAALPATGGTRPVMARTGGDNITLASGNSIFGLDVSASGGRGIFGSSVGTLLVTNIGSINTTNGAAVDFANGTLNVMVTNISVNGGANGIKLSTTAGSFFVPGSGGAGSGGTIQNITGANASTDGSGVFLSSATNITLMSMTLSNHQNYAIRGTTVNNFTLINSSVVGTNGNSEDDNEAAVSFANLIGTGTILNCTISGGRENNLEVLNSAGALNSLLVSNCIIQANQGLGNHGISIDGSGTAKMTNSVFACTFRTNRVQHFRANALDSAVLDVTFGGSGLSNTLTGGHTNALAQDILFTSDDSALIAFDCLNNSINGAILSAIDVFVANTSVAGTRIAGTIGGNTIGTSGVANSGSAQASGITVVGTGSGTINVAIANNTIRQYNEFGIELEGGDASPVLNATVTGNSIKEPVGFALNGIQLNAGTTAAGAATFCVDIGGAGALENDIVGSGGSGATDFRLRQRNSSTVRLPGYVGSPTNDAAVVAFVQARNTGAETGSAVHSTLGSAGFLGGAACTAPLLIAPGGIPAATATIANSEPDVKAVSIEAVPTSKLGLALEDSTATADQGILDKEKLQPIATAAIQRWLAAGLSTNQSTALNSISFRVTDLAGWYLAASSSGLIQLDRDAAGHGWFIDPTPLDDSEFSKTSSSTRLYTDPHSASAGRIDLLTTVMHEMGHVLGVSDSYSEEARESVMYGSLTQGERRLPVKGQAQGAIPGTVTGTHFLAVPLTIGDLPSGKSVTIVFNATINDPFPTGVCQVTNQAAISATDIAGAFTVLTDDPDTGAFGDVTVTPVFIPPTITFCPPNVVTNTTGSCGQTVAFGATAVGCPPPIIVYKTGGTNITSPFFFSVGLTTVSVTATNAAGTNTTCSFTVTVIDSEPPVLTCTNITVGTASNQCSAVVTFTTNATDNCTVTNVTFTPPSGSTFPKGTNTVVGVATDSSGNTNGCTFLVIVNDTQAPAISVPPDIMGNADTGQCSKSNVTFTATATDNCDTNVTVVCSPVSGSTFDVGTNTVSCTAMDSSGNNSTNTFKVIVQDMEAPMITCPSDIVVGSTNPCVVVSFSGPTVTDNCVVLTNFCSPPSGFCFPTGTNTVTCTAIDTSSNSMTCSFTVRVFACDIVCPNNIVTNVASNDCAAVVTFIDPTLTGECGGGVTCVPPSGSSFPAGTNIVTCTTSNGASCSFTISVLEDVPPMITCPSNIVVTADDGQCSKSNVTWVATATDNCDTNVVVVCVPPIGSTFNVGTNDVTCTATDDSGNTNACSFTVRVLDMQPPVINCPSNIVVAASGGQCSSNVTFNVTPTDNCPGVGTPLCTPASGATFSIGPTLVNCSVLDAVGNSNACSFTVTVLDQEKPTINCSSNIVVNTDVGQCSKSNVTFTVTATDNCDTNVTIVCAPSSGSTFSVGTNTVTCTATDSSGNTNSCSFLVTVRDMDPPNIMCPSDLIVSAGTNLCVPVNFTLTITNACGLLTNFCSPTNGFCFPLGTNSVACTAIDTSSNSASCTFTITVVPCTLTCPSNIVVTNAVGQCGAIVNFTNTITGDCGTVTNNPPSGSFFPVGTTTVTSTFSLGPSCTFTVTVLDRDNPAINCSSNIVAATDTGQCSKSNVTFTVTATDNCGASPLLAETFTGTNGGFTVSTPLVFNTPWTYNAGVGSWQVVQDGAETGFPMTTRLISPVLTLTQSGVVRLAFEHRYSLEQGNWDGAQVLVSVNGGPFVSVPSAAFVSGGYNGAVLPNSASVLAGQIAFVLDSANHQGPGYVTSVADLGLFNPGDTVAVQFLYAGDTNTRGNFVPSWEITSVSLTGPVSGPVPVVCSPPSGSTFPKGTNTVNCLVVDAAGNSNSCSFTVAIIDLQPPTMNCSTNLVLAANAGQCSRSNVTFTVTASDNCDTNVAVVCAPPSGSTFNVGTNTVTCTTSDAAGNTNSCSFAVTVQDLQPPSITGVTNTPAVLWPPNHKMRDVTVTYTVTDNCPTTNCMLSVASNEPTNGTGDGDTAPDDWEIVDAHHVRLRAERAAKGDGRIYTVTVICTDGAGNITSNSMPVVVAHNITAPVSGSSFKVNTSVSFAGTFWDIPGNRHSASWTFDNLSTAGSVTEPSGLKNGAVKGTYKFNTPGVYKVTLFIKDQKGVTSWVNTAGDVESIVVIYDPNGGYTIGGGWINSPAGAYTLNTNLTGKLSFGFSSQYFKGATNPKGETLVEFLAGDLEFNALNFDYLVIAGAKAQFRGFGKINGISGYDFTLTVLDGDLLTPKGPDRFRIKIWEKVSGTLIYDNEPGRSDADDPITPVGDATSSVVIKK